MAKLLKNINIKTLLIFPATFPAIKNVSERPPLGIAALAGYLNFKGYFKVGLVDLNDDEDFNCSDFFKRNKNRLFFNFIVDSSASKKVDKKSRFYEAAKGLLDSRQPHLVGFSVLYLSQLFSALLIAKIFKSLMGKKVFIVLGGPTISKNIELIIKNHRIAGMVDALITGDGEEPLAKLIFNLANSRDFKDIPNLHYLDNSRFQKSNLFFRSSPEHLSIIPDFEGLDIKVIPLRVATGCYWGKCTFCSYQNLHPLYKPIPPVKLIGIIKGLMERYGLNRFIFYDDAIPPLYLNFFSELLIKKGINIKWDCKFLCLDRQFLEFSVLEIMKKAGCCRVTFGLESMSPRILRLMNKMHTPGSAIKILEAFKEAGIKVTLLVIFGFPTETETEMLATLDFLKTHKHLYDWVNIQKFSLEGDTDVYNRPSKFFVSQISKKDKRGLLRPGYRFKSWHRVSEQKINNFINTAKTQLGQKFFEYTPRS